MPISVQNIVDRVKSALDADGQGDYYLFDQDFKPAINYAIDFVVSQINHNLEQKKFSGEILRELMRTRVYQTSAYSRVQFDASDNVWSILAVYPNPSVSIDPATVLPDPDTEPATSYLVTTASYLSGDESAKRLTLEEWNENKNNPFVSGNNVVTATELQQYAYLTFQNYSSDYQYAATREIEVRPELDGKLVAISFVEYPTQVSLITDNVEFPESATNLIVDLSLRWIAFKQGDGTNINALSDRDARILINNMM